MHTIKVMVLSAGAAHYDANTIYGFELQRIPACQIVEVYGRDVRTRLDNLGFSEDIANSVWLLKTGTAVYLTVNCTEEELVQFGFEF